jgi:hypothetical protein
MGRDYVSEPLPQTDILFIFRMIYCDMLSLNMSHYDYAERRWYDTDRGKTEEV